MTGKKMTKRACDNPKCRHFDMIIDSNQQHIKEVIMPQGYESLKFELTEEDSTCPIPTINVIELFEWDSPFTGSIALCESCNWVAQLMLGN